jgi:predicted kinase
MSGALFVVVTGPPASGKSTLANMVVAELGLPLIAKDAIKEAMMAERPVPDVDASRRIGQAAITAMYDAAAAAHRGAVLDSNFHRSLAADQLRRLPGQVVELFCRCDREVAYARYRSRLGQRHLGHFDGARTMDELWSDEVTNPIAGGWPVLEVDTNTPVDLTAAREFVHRSLIPADIGANVTHRS